MRKIHSKMKVLEWSQHILAAIIITFKYFSNTFDYLLRQVAQWATMAHHGASIMFGDTIIYDAQRQITLNWKQ